jgi:hypothetical protein
MEDEVAEAHVIDWVRATWFCSKETRWFEGYEYYVYRGEVNGERKIALVLKDDSLGVFFGPRYLRST